MDITKSSKRIKTSKYINGETVNYSAMFMIIFLAFLVIKQVLKLGFSISSDIAVFVSFIVCGIASYFIEKKLVFNHKANNGTIKQILFYTLGMVVNIGFFKLFDFVFCDLFKFQYYTAYFASTIIIFVFKYYFDRIIVFDCRYDAKNNKNGRLYKAFFDNRFVVLSVGIATIGILFVYMIFKLFPFGDMTVMRMDLYHQYGPLFAELYDRVINHQSFLYSWESGGGSSFLGNYFNYLSSPLSVIIFLFDKKQISLAITALVALKGVLSAGTFTYFIKQSQKSHSYASASFGVFYAFCGYFLAYYWNIMWIDGMILLPLIALGIEKIINNGKPVLYIASLCLMFYSNYYIGFMMCIFSILYFVVYYFVNNNANELIKRNAEFTKKQFIQKAFNLKFINRGFIFAGSSILSAALCACVLIPVYFILQQCSATSDSFPTTFESYFNLINIFSSHFAGLETTIRSSGDDVLPNIYCGVIIMILVPLYAMNRNISIKEKTLYFLLLIFFIFSFDNNVMNFIWHAFHFPNDLPYRFSFMYSFIVLIISFRVLKNIKGIRYQDIALVGIIALLLVLYFQTTPTNKIKEITIYITIAFILVWTAVLLLVKKGKMNKFVIGVAIIAMTFCEVIISDSNSYLFTQPDSAYVENFDDYTEAIEYTHNKDKDFYRTELCYLNTRMDPCLYGYNGISTFSSMAYERYSRTQYSLGMFGNRINSYTYNTQTPVYNMMFNIKYLMHKNTGVTPSKNLYKLFYTTDNYNVEVYENKYHLPIAFETSNELADWYVEEGNPFNVQEDFINRAAGVSNVFIPVEYLSTTGVDVDCDQVNENGTFSFYKESAGDNSGSIEILITPTNDSNVYVYLDSPSIDNVNYYWDNDESIYQNINEPYIMDLGYHKKGEEITVSLNCSNVDASASSFEIYAYTVNEDVFTSAYDMLNSGRLNVTDYNSTTINGEMTAGYDGYLYTSIPYDDGWSVYIDGQKQKTFELGNAMLATTVKRGEHKVTFKYSPKGLKYGLVTSVATWCSVIAYFIIKKFNFNKNKKNIIC